MRDVPLQRELGESSSLHLPAQPFSFTIPDSQFERYVASTSEEKANILLSLLQEDFPDARVGEQLGADSPRGYASVCKLLVGERLFAMKYLHFQNDLSEFGAIPAILDDKRTLQADLPHVAKYAGSISVTQDRPMCVIAEYVDGIQLPTWMRENHQSLDAINDHLCSILHDWYAHGFHLVDENPENFHILPDGTAFLIDPAAISANQQMVHGTGGHTLSLIGDGGLSEELELLGFIDLFEDHSLSMDSEPSEELPDLPAQEPLSIDELVKLLMR